MWVTTAEREGCIGAGEEDTLTAAPSFLSKAYQHLHLRRRVRTPIPIRKFEDSFPWRCASPRSSTPGRLGPGPDECGRASLAEDWRAHYDLKKKHDHQKQNMILKNKKHDPQKTNMAVWAQTPVFITKHNLRITFLF